MKSIRTKFKAHCLRLLSDVARSGQPLLVTSRGKPLARILPSGAVDAKPPQDTLEGSVTILGDILSPVLSLSAFSAAHGDLFHAERPHEKHPATKRRRTP